jgi:hypothetical protein
MFPKERKTNIKLDKPLVKPNQRERKHYSARESTKRRKVLIDASSTEESSGTDSEEDFEREYKGEGDKVLIAELDELE